MALNDPGPDAGETVATYRRRPAQSDKAALARAHMPLVRKIAWHVHGRVSSAIDIEDLVQIGMVALVEAANAYEDRGHTFATYASLRIRGGMIDHLRGHATICRSGMAKRRELAGVRARLASRFGRQPSDAEMAEEMGLDATGYHAAVDAAQSVQQESLDDVYSDQSIWFADADEDAADTVLDRERLKTVLAGAIKRLPEREAMVLQLYFVEELNLEEIGQTLGIGAARVCQIKKSALDALRGGLADLR